MKAESKDIRKWWMIFSHFPPEPYGLWRSYLLAACITLILFSLSAFVAYRMQGACTELTFLGKTSVCKSQNEYREGLLKKEEENKEAARERSRQLKEIRLNRNDKLFGQSWTWFESELAQLEKVEKSDKYKLPSIGRGSLSLIGIILLSLLFYAFLSRIVALHAKSTFRHRRLSEIDGGSTRDWAIPHILIAIVLTVPVLLSELSTSVLAKEKTWFGYDSFCVTPAAFVIKCIGFVAFGFVAAAPFTTLWRLSRTEYIPDPAWQAKDGKFGAERYVEFLQTWALWLILAPSALGIFLFRYAAAMENVFSPVRLLYGVGVGIVIFLIVIRLIRNAVILRFKCRQVLANHDTGKTDRPPVDPTIGFLGTDWWKLPATISVSLASLWALLEFLGLSKIIADIAQKMP
ncbi:MAG: hypothetical protein A4E62_02909 [Syntrophorhabdus sp. PtaU1.Bin002]|nr:MAG: hypothetical protein A4E58_02791 [Syntrophorhabdus sp. PtaB.Bin006]OPY63950.1 MAG: hypothetical protein A4E62_02909 [Syntrophorhabdus sp. PtaU1.Bin002]